MRITRIFLLEAAHEPRSHADLRSAFFDIDDGYELRLRPEIACVEVRPRKPGDRRYALVPLGNIKDMTVEDEPASPTKR